MSQTTAHRENSNPKSNYFSENITEATRLYGDILYQTHPRSKNHPPMSLYQRAAQFAPFAALTGFSEMAEDTAHSVTEAEDAILTLEVDIL